MHSLGDLIRRHYARELVSVHIGSTAWVELTPAGCADDFRPGVCKHSWGKCRHALNCHNMHTS